MEQIQKEIESVLLDEIQFSVEPYIGGICYHLYRGNKSADTYVMGVAINNTGTEYSDWNSWQASALSGAVLGTGSGLQELQELLKQHDLIK